MKLNILTIGHKMPQWVEIACAEYIKRMPRELTIHLHEIKPDRRSSGKTSLVVQEAEGQRILELAGQDMLVVLDERGQEVTTTQLADRMEGWMQNGRDVAFAIGGADGLHPVVKQKAQWQWSLSRLTLPHAMVRILLVEQLYRANSIIHHHPYHKD